MTVGLEFARVLKLPTLRENLSLSKRGANTESMAYKRSRIALSGKGEILHSSRRRALHEESRQRARVFEYNWSHYWG